ncbi:MAG TPA: hypothetical protein VF131_01695 [Blastocatellia bacterium]|nr:hypothetical protein [Blastocatellia bacterium]
MSISENNSSKKKLELLGKRYLGEAVVSESEIYDFIRTLQVGDWENFAARMQVVVDAVSPFIDTDEIDESNLRIIKQLAKESKDKGYQQIIGAMIAAVEQGGEGIQSTHKTASMAIDMVFIWTPDYFSALKQYEKKLREIRRGTKSRR